MNVEILDLNGELKKYSGVTRMAFTNHETFGLPEPLQLNGSSKLLLVNANNYTALTVEP